MSRKIFVVLGLIALSLMIAGNGCGPKPEAEVSEPPVTPEDTTTYEPPVEPEVPADQEVMKLTEDEFRVAYFDFDKYNLRNDARSALEYNSRLLKDNPEVKILIEGHCDERGTVEYNLALGEKRAKAAMDYLASLGIDKGRMATISYGKEKPVALGHDENSWSKNRRAEFRITEQ